MHSLKLPVAWHRLFSVPGVSFAVAVVVKPNCRPAAIARRGAFFFLLHGSRRDNVQAQGPREHCGAIVTESDQAIASAHDITGPGTRAAPLFSECHRVVSLGIDESTIYSGSPTLSRTKNKQQTNQRFSGSIGHHATNQINALHRAGCRKSAAVQP
jgi:hypothetical protein